MVRFWLLVACWFLPLWVQAATITAEFDRNPVALGDPLILRFTADGVVGAEPDFTPLSKDFEIQGRSQSNSFSMVNGVSSVQTVWELTVFPRVTGNVQVPPIAFGIDQSQPLVLQVLDQPAQNTNADAGAIGADIFVELSAEPQQPYVQQQIIVTQRLLHLAPLQPQASLTHPSIEGGKGNIQQLGKTRNTTLMRDGRNYQVIERRYALYPQQSGDLVLGRTTFEGSLATGNSQFDPFGVAGPRVRRFSEPFTLKIQTQPAGYTGQHWLPAKSISLNAHWDKPADKLKAGEPNGLTLAIVADGLAAEQLPKLELSIPIGVKAYTDQPEFRNESNAQGIVGVRQEKWVLVAPYNGDYALPELKLDWWNSTTGKQETAMLNAVTLRVSGGEAAPAGQLPPASQQPAVSLTEEAAVPSVKPQALADSLLPSNWSVNKKIIMALLFLWVLLTTAWLYWQWKHRKSATTIAKSENTVLPPRNPKIALQALATACKSNQPQAAHDALVNWIEVGLNLRPALISRLREQASPLLQAEIDALGAALYGRGNGAWQGAGLWKAITTFQPAAQKSAKPTTGLAELYPKQ
jgi:hypothetical protein